MTKLSTRFAWLVTIAVMAGCSSGSATQPVPVGATPAYVAPDPTPDPIAQAETAFIGHLSQETIRTKLNRAFLIYGMAATADSYMRATSALVALRKDAQTAGFSDVTEIAILDRMISDALPMSFAKGAGWVAAELRLGQ